MIVRLIKKTKIYNFTLPTTVSGNYWITDNDYLGNNRNLINVEEANGSWRIKSDFETKIMQGEQEVSSAILKEYSLYFLKINTDNEFVILYCSPAIENRIKKLEMSEREDILIGNDPKADIHYSYPLVSKNHARLIYQQGKWLIQDLSSKYGTYVNNEFVTNKTLEYGDIIFIMGLKIIVLKDTLIVNEIGNLLKYNQNRFKPKQDIVQNQIEMDNADEEGIEFFTEENYFYRSPRFKTKIEDVNIVIDSPPAKENKDKTPAIYTLGPMLTMSMMSISMGYTSLVGVIDGSRDVSEVLPSLITSGAMLASMLLWPLLSKTFQKRQQKKREKERQEKYAQYINIKRKEIQEEMQKQRQILIDNYLPLEQTVDIINSKKRNLWEREITQDDFLDLRLGIGSSSLRGTVKFPEKHFALETDNLLEEVYKLGAESRILENVPISTSFVENNVAAIIGTATIKQPFIQGLLLQMITFHSYEDLKIVILTNDKNKDNWDYMKVSPHCWSDDKSQRYFATTIDEAKELSLNLEKVYQNRKYSEVDGKRQQQATDYKNNKPYYVLITDDYKTLRDIEIIKDVASSDINIGFSLIVISPRLVNLPNETKSFISIGDKKSGIFGNELVANKQKEFNADYNLQLNMYESCKKLANIPIDIAKENRKLPNGISFLEMYNVGMIEQLNILNRWKNNDPTNSLQAPIGVDQSHELFKLDLHEKYYGPHGLIAGMTGSGKSEFIITYILSMALNYHPYEVSFVLIDYKGGGLAGVFENKEAGIKLPHLAGTITNLETIEMNRSLASIQSELRRRQIMFNKARDELDESTIDIYKYQALYRKGLVKEPISHLFIVSDEFAELKSQQPEFMDQLISTARIGRSLGVHLILATQKPAGVVNDQIWSNSKFRVCLKVQDKADSMDMIKCPDAASLKNPGRFYLQVGYNELFALGQSAWAGAQYYPTEKRKKKTDTSINIIDNVGTTIKSLETKKQDTQVASLGEEVTNIVKYIINEATKENIRIPQLWLDKIPNIIYVDEMKKKYNIISQKNIINPIIGEYDNPDNQSQHVLTLPLSEDGNTIIFGSGGSGKEQMLASIIYSTVTSHTPEEINFYILDFGAETTNVFKNIPHVGEVILSTQSEKIINLFKYISTVINERKKLFVEYNGSFSYYLKNSGKQIPMITIIINNHEAFIETYPDYQEVMEQLTRDCNKYGIVFILTTSGTNTVRYRLRQNFKQNVVLQFNDEGDYSSVISGVRKKRPSPIFGRGLIAKDDIYEFQTTSVYRDGNVNEYIKVIAKKLQELTQSKAQKIAILPEVVTIDELTENLGEINKLPVGIERDSLSPALININNTYLITGQDISTSAKFIKGIASVITKTTSKLIIMDALNIIDKVEENIILEKNNYEKSIIELSNKTSNNVYVIIGLTKFLEKLTPENKQLFIEKISESKDISTNKFIIVESVDDLKTIAYEPWYKSKIDASSCIWLGNGITDQFTIKVLNNSRELRQQLKPGFGYVINKGNASVTKLITKI